MAEIDILPEALLIGFESDPTPIVPADYWEIIKGDFKTLRRQDVYNALQDLYSAGKVDRDMMYDKKCNSEIWHYFGLDWNGKPSIMTATSYAAPNTRTVAHH